VPVDRFVIDLLAPRTISRLRPIEIIEAAGGAAARRPTAGPPEAR